jgi:uncharacterized protein
MEEVISPDDRIGATVPSVLDVPGSTASGERAVAQPEERPRPRPTTGEERYHGIDAVRGFALLGLIVAHVAIFAHPVDGTSFTWTTLPYAGITRLYFDLAFLFVYGKASFLFGLLFGASVVFFARNHHEDAGRQLWYRRMRWLALFGTLHGVFLFHADILLFYALCGLIGLWRVRLRSARWLFTAGVVSYLVGTLLVVGVTLLAAGAGDPSGFFGAQRQTDAFGGSFWSGASYRALIVLSNLANLPLVFWTGAGVMMLGMGFMKSGVLTGERSEAFYLRLCIAGLGVGFPLTAGVYGWATGDPSDPTRAALWMAVHQLVGIPTALGYLSGIIYLEKRRLLPSLVHGLACVGRMALTNYLLQSVIAGFIFYGWGLGLYGTSRMGALIPILIGILGVNLLLSVLWMRRFYFGPMEWVWRWATYRDRPKMLRKSNAVAGGRRVVPAGGSS